MEDVRFFERYHRVRRYRFSYLIIITVLSLTQDPLLPKHMPQSMKSELIKTFPYEYFERPHELTNSTTRRRFYDMDTTKIPVTVKTEVIRTGRIKSQLPPYKLRSIPRIEPIDRSAIANVTMHGMVPITSVADEFRAVFGEPRRMNITGAQGGRKNVFRKPNHCRNIISYLVWKGVKCMRYPQLAVSLYDR